MLSKQVYKGGEDLASKQYFNTIQRIEFEIEITTTAEETITTAEEIERRTLLLQPRKRHRRKKRSRMADFHSPKFTPTLEMKDTPAVLPRPISKL